MPTAFLSGFLLSSLGYLQKKTKHNKWQKRWFETNGCFLTYYKKEGQKLLAALNLPQVGEIRMDDEDDATGVGLFTIELNERIYVVKAPTNAEARRWVEGLNMRKKAAGNMSPTGLGSIQPGFLPQVDKAPLMNMPHNQGANDNDSVGLKPGRGGEMWEVRHDYSF
jgi:hypothetical protein